MLRGGLISTSGRSWQKILCFCVICSGFGQVLLSDARKLSARVSRRRRRRMMRMRMRMMVMVMVMMMMMMVEEVVIEIDKENTCLRRAIPPLMSYYVVICLFLLNS